MDDLALTRAGAVAMGYTNISDHWGGLPMSTKETGLWNPLYDDAQAMALVKKLRLEIARASVGDAWVVVPFQYSSDRHFSADLNRAICECVAKIKVSPEPTP